MKCDQVRRQGCPNGEGADRAGNARGVFLFIHVVMISFYLCRSEQGEESLLEVEILPEWFSTLYHCYVTNFLLVKPSNPCQNIVTSIGSSF
jgi:hypothetical protein